MEPKESFTLFPFLPPEIRRLIWQACIPQRVIEVQEPPSEVEQVKYTNCRLSWTSTQNAKPPIITRICRESRSVAIESGGMISEDINPPLDGSLARMKNVWVGTKHDTLVWCWEMEVNDADSYGEPYIKSEGYNRWEAYTRFLMSHFKRTAMSMIMGRRICSFPHPTEDCHFLSGNEITMMEQCKDFTLCLGQVTVHMSSSRAFQSELWGTTGEELIQLVDPLDTQRIRRFRKEMKEDDRQDCNFIDFVLEKMSSRRRSKSSKAD